MEEPKPRRVAGEGIICVQMCMKLRFSRLQYISAGRAARNLTGVQHTAHVQLHWSIPATVAMATWNNGNLTLIFIHKNTACECTCAWATVLVSSSLHMARDTDMRRLSTGIRSGKCVVRRCCRCANVIKWTYTNLDTTVLPTTHLGYMV